jgi:cytochrome c oxidase cbb3-type subunit 3
LATIIAGIAVQQVDAGHRAAMVRADPATVLANPAMRARGIAAGRKVFASECAACHGTDAKGDRRRAVPDLTDSDFLFGEGSVEQIEQIVLHGIRSGDSKGWDLAWMPAYATVRPYSREAIPPLAPQELRAIVAFLRILGGQSGQAAEAARGQELFTGRAGCWDCHGGDARGDPAIGAPNLTDRIWLKGTGSEADIYGIIAEGMHGTSPAFAHRLDAYKARSVSIYAASLHPANLEGSQ